MLNDSIAALNLPDGVIQIALTLTYVWAIFLAIIGFLIALVRRVLSLGA